MNKTDDVEYPSCFRIGIDLCFGDYAIGCEQCEFCEWSEACQSGVEPCEFCEFYGECKGIDNEV